MATDTRTVEDASVESEIETTKSERVAMMVIRRLNLTDDPEFVGQHGLVRRALASLHVTSFIHSEPQLSEEERMRRALSVMKENLRVLRLGRSYIEQIHTPRSAATRPRKLPTRLPMPTSKTSCRQNTRRHDAPANGFSNGSGNCANRPATLSKPFRTTNRRTGSSSALTASWRVRSSLTNWARLWPRHVPTPLRRRQNLTGYLAFSSSVRTLATLIFPILVTDALSNPVITRLRQQYLDDQNKESEWSSRYGPDHTAARNLRAEMAGLQRAIWDEVSRIAESYKSELQIAKSQEEAIDKRMQEVFQNSGSTRQSQVRLRELETAANSYRGIYETFLSRFTQSVQQQSFPSTEARVVTFASSSLASQLAEDRTVDRARRGLWPGLRGAVRHSVANS